MRIGSLFSGIGGLELGLEWARVGRTVWQVEKEPFCRQVLAKHWPDVPRYEDVREVGAHNLSPTDLVCGGFPCQDISHAGKGAGLAGERSGLWREYRRVVGELRPRFVVVENVSALRSRGLGTVLGDLAALGYDAWWDCIPASAVGAPHQRDRLFIVGYTGSPGLPQRQGQPGDDGAQQPPAERAGGEREMADSTSRGAAAVQQPGRGRVIVTGGQDLADTKGRVRQRQTQWAAGHAALGGQNPGGRSTIARLGRVLDGLPDGLDGRWPADPGKAQHEWEAPRTAQGVPNRPARLKALGNAVVPQVGYVIGRVVKLIEARGRL